MGNALRRFYAVFVARNKEFYRDRATLGWNLFFPFLALIGFSFIFGGDGQEVFKVALVGDSEPPQAAFFSLDQVEYVPIEDRAEALRKVGRHQFDIAVDSAAGRYWINSESPKGSLAERLLLAGPSEEGWQRSSVEGEEIRYVDWLVPGLLGMNMMFSCLFGVGFVIVRYRKSGVLRRFKATPLHSVEFLSAQVVSRMLLVLVATAMVYVGTDALLDFHMAGSYLDLIAVFALGAFNLVAMGLVFASRTASEELAGGLMNLITFPMMFLSGVWFSLDGSPDWVQRAARTLPLTHITEAARAIMTDGARLPDVMPNLLFLVVSSVLFLAAGALAFRWE